MEALDQTGNTFGLLDSWPVGTIHNDQVVDAFVGEVHSGVLEWVFRFHKGGRQRIWLPWGYSIAVCTSFMELGCYVRPKH